MWFPVDPVPRTSTLRVRRRLAPRARGTCRGRSSTARPSGSPTARSPSCPTSTTDPERFRVLGWALEPGDAVFFHMLTLHAAGGVGGPHRRRVLSVRFLGDDMVHAPRPWATSPPFPGLVDELAARRADGPPALPGLAVTGDASVTVREIVTVGHPVLRERAAEVDPADVAGARDAGADRRPHRHDARRQRRRLAANQIGVPRRVAVIEVNHNPRYPYKPPIPLTVVINPVIEADRRRAGGDQRGLPLGAQPPRLGAPPREHPRALARRARHPPRRGAPRPHRGNVPARVRPPRRRAVPRSGRRPAPRSRPGSRSSASAGRPSSSGSPASSSVSAPDPMAAATSTFWCERAWLGPGAADHRDGVLVTVDGGDDHRRRGRRRGGTARRQCACAASPCPGSPTPTAMPSTAPCAGAPTTRRDVLDVARADVRARRDARSRHLRTPGDGGVRRDARSPATPCVGEFHYLHHQPGGVPYADANEIGRRLLDAADTAGVRITLLDTCYLHGGFGVAPNDRAAALQRRHGRGVGRARRRRSPTAHRPVPGSEPPSTPSAPSIRSRSPTSRRWASERGAVLHAHVSEQPQENDRLPGRPRVHARRAAGPPRRPRRAVLRGPRHAPRRRATSALLAAGRRRVLHLPDHRARPRRRNRTDGGPRRRARLCLGSDSHAVIDPFEEARAVELDERLASGRRGTHDPSALAAGRHGGGLPQPRLATAARIAAGSARRLRDRRPRRRPPRRRTTGTDPAASVVFAATAADVRHVVVGGEHVVRDGAHRAIDVAAELDRSITDAWRANVSTTVVRRDRAAHDQRRDARYAAAAA